MGSSIVLSLTSILIRRPLIFTRRPTTYLNCPDYLAVPPDQSGVHVSKYYCKNTFNLTRYEKDNYQSAGQTGLQNAYDQVKDLKGGLNAHYIPFLANVDPNLFGISLTLPDGEQFNVGDTDYKFGVESVSKVLTAILVLDEFGAKTVLEKIGADATGLPFNSIFAILLENDHPRPRW